MNDRSKVPLVIRICFARICLTALFTCLGGSICGTFAQSPDNGLIARLLPRATRGNAVYQIRLAEAYLESNRPEDMQQAFRWFSIAANHGDPLAQTEIGMMYQGGLGVTVDLTQAREWYQRAASIGYPPALVRLASLYSRGKGVPADEEEALRLLGRAAQAAYAPAKTDLAVLYLFGHISGRNEPEAMRMLHEVAGHDVKAAFVLGLCYQRGKGVPQDSQASMRWYSKAAQRGYGPAENNLAFFYANGVGTRADAAIAMSWYRRAAEHGIPDALVALGQLQMAAGSIEDRRAALVWFAAARRAGGPNSESPSGFTTAMQELAPAERESVETAAAAWVAQHRFVEPDLARALRHPIRY